MDITSDNELTYIGFWARVVASFVDTILMIAVIFLLGITLAITMPDMGSSLPRWLDIAINIGIASGYIMLWLKYGGTPGKRILKAKIISKDGSPLTPVKAIVRYLAYFISMLPFGLGFLWVALDKQKRGWHDIIAGTLVIKD